MLWDAVADQRGVIDRVIPYVIGGNTCWVRSIKYLLNRNIPARCHRSRKWTWAFYFRNTVHIYMVINDYQRGVIDRVNGMLRNDAFLPPLGDDKHIVASLPERWGWGEQCDYSAITVRLQCDYSALQCTTV